MNVADNLLFLKRSLPGDVKLVAVSKMQPASVLKDAYLAGQRIFGENKVQELVCKQPQLPLDIQWHFIGHLQTNKVKYIGSFISLIHSIDSLNLLKEVNKQASRHDRVIECLLQFHIAMEETKFGLNLEEAKELLESDRYLAMKNIKITGVMGMSSFSDDPDLVRREFAVLRNYFLTLKSLYFGNCDTFKEISMGMTGDYTIAIEEGSTMVRIGTAIFGERNH
ncbi:MAG: YggS family pyridoxal phosphate-dependent enzyme [Bacteroidales bacterium]|nr:YggS family pyridoxal phosphate-dependent enzyme [Bacteroidales bacterium]